MSFWEKEFRRTGKYEKTWERGLPADIRHAKSTAFFKSSATVKKLKHKSNTRFPLSLKKLLYFTPHPSDQRLGSDQEGGDAGPALARPSPAPLSSRSLEMRATSPPAEGPGAPRPRARVCPNPRCWHGPRLPSFP